MSILVTKKTRVICQGITGNNGTFHSEQATKEMALENLHSYTYTV
jgi:succinyl-CoA synthetase alpha subunit